MLRNQCIYIPNIVLKEKLSYDEMIKRFNLNSKQFRLVCIGLYHNDSNLYDKFKSYLSNFKSQNIIINLIINSNATTYEELENEINMDKNQIRSFAGRLKIKNKEKYMVIRDKINKLNNNEYMFNKIYDFVITHNCGYYELLHSKFKMHDSNIRILLCNNSKLHPEKVKRIKSILKANQKNDKYLFNKMIFNDEEIKELCACIFVYNMTYKEICEKFDIRYSTLETFINRKLSTTNNYLYDKIKYHYRNIS